ncbi:MAG: tRNA pseudouridine(55) synthase TruB [Candidatus Gracilibacteria bacterium]|nr:tRNA pseudouridine(55) synthase TruB [Candidatus Gracilibacteria bacterium]
MFYLIDKPLDFTSFDSIAVLRKKLHTKRIGHTGTLDPLATGGLLIAAGNYTKLIPYFEKDTKEYEFSINFDGQSDSYDLGTQVDYISEEAQEKAKKDITKEKIQELLKTKFTGEILQIPPKYSALKIGGRKAIDMIVAGDTDFKMNERKAFVNNIELLDFSYPTASFRAEVSAGTYIRSIAYDMGIIFKTGGYITKLRRTKVGSLDLSMAQTIENFDKNKFFDLKILFKNKTFIELSKEVLDEINLGKKIKGKFDFKIGEEMFVFDGNNVTNIVIYDGELLIPRKKI